MIDRNPDLPIALQATALNISRGAVYDKPRPVSAEDLAIMRRIVELHLAYPFAGSRMLRDMLNREGVAIGRRHTATLMRRMAIEAIFRRPNMSKPAPRHQIYPYLLRRVKSDRARHVWTNLGLKDGTSPIFRWLAASSISLRSSTWSANGYCRIACRSRWRPTSASRRALAKHGKPEIFNMDQGSQFTSEAFTGLLTKNAIAISMEGKGSWRDNVFVERLWRSVKNEEVNLRAYDSIGEVSSSIGRYLEFFNTKRPHSRLDRRTRDEAYLIQRLSRRRHEYSAALWT
jgi:putative transposase